MNLKDTMRLKRLQEIERAVKFQQKQIINVYSKRKGRARTHTNAFWEMTFQPLMEAIIQKIVEGK